MKLTDINSCISQINSIKNLLDINYNWLRIHYPTTHDMSEYRNINPTDNAIDNKFIRTYTLAAYKSMLSIRLENLVNQYPKIQIDELDLINKLKKLDDIESTTLADSMFRSILNKILYEQ